MAKKEAEPKIVLEREYNVPLRREFLKTPNWKRTKKAAKALREFLIKHMKSDNVKIGKHLNEKLWEKGIRNPPHHIKVIAKKDDKGLVMAELVGAPVEETKEEKVKGKKKEKVEKEEKAKEEEKTKEEEKKEEVKKEKAEVLKKEVPKEQAKIIAAPKQAVRESKIPARK